MAVNLRAPFLCLQEAVRSMKTRGGGSIVNIGSINAYVGLPALGPYSVSKGGLMTMTKNAAAALGRYRIRVNQLNVGLDVDRRGREGSARRRQGARLAEGGRRRRDRSADCCRRWTSRWPPPISRPTTAPLSQAPSSISNSFRLAGCRPLVSLSTARGLRFFVSSASPGAPARAFDA